MTVPTSFLLLQHLNTKTHLRWTEIMTEHVCCSTNWKQNKVYVKECNYVGRDLKACIQMVERYWCWLKQGQNGLCNLCMWPYSLEQDMIRLGGWLLLSFPPSLSGVSFLLSFSHCVSICSRPYLLIVLCLMPTYLNFLCRKQLNF